MAAGSLAVILDFILFLAGLVLAGLTLRDVFETVVVPGANRAFLRVAHRLIYVLLPIWKAVRGRRRGLSGNFAPMVLVASFVLWISFLAIGFGLMIYALRGSFDPRPDNIGHAIYMAGSAVLTLGLNGEQASGAGRWIVLGAGFCGLAAMTMAVTYLLEVQSSVARRDTVIMKLNTSAGDPPSALTLLENFAAIGNLRELPELLREGRNWCATVRQSHSAHPSLIYFQTAGTGAGWPAALGTLLDLALILEYCVVDDELRGPALLLSADGTRLATGICAQTGLKYQPADASPASFAQILERLATAKYPLRSDFDAAALAERRAQQQAPVEAIARHLGKPSALLVPPVA